MDQRKVTMKKHLLLLIGITMALLFSACGKESASPSASSQPTSPSKQFRILAGSELKDVESIIQRFANSNGLAISMEYTGTLDAVDRLQEKHEFDAVWVSHGKYLQLVPGVRDQV